MLILLFLPFNAIDCQVVRTGLEELMESDFALLKNKRVGLITNPTAVDHNYSTTTDLLFNASGVKLVALYGPEHGVRGDMSAGEQVGTTIDPVTKLPVFSLYGKTRKPTSEMLKGIDILVYDIQDIGSRSYTYISTLGLAMEAAAENNIPFVVLDRPNPLGGIRMEGAVTRPSFMSFVSQYPVPYIHGLTVGELASFINGEGLLHNGIKCDLTVIRMNGWKRSMMFEDTGLPWIPTSPHIPHSITAFYYPATGIVGELYVVNIGVGYTLPFQLFATEWTDADSLAESLNNLELEGVYFRPVHYRPYYSVLHGQVIHGIQLHLINLSEAPLTLLQFYILQEAHRLWPGKDVFRLCEKSRLDMFDKVCGTDQVRLQFEKDFLVDSILELWNGDIQEYRQKTQKYLLYE